MNRRWTGGLVVLGVVLSLAVAQGVTLTRCLLTGTVMLSCCCEHAASDSRSVVAPADDCCSVQRLAAPWNSTQVPTQEIAALPPPSSWATAVVATLPAGITFVTHLPEPEGSPPPLWLGAPRI